MCPRTREKFEEIRGNKRRQILNAAIECFAARGYHAVSVSELAEHAGISKGLMYNYFKSKDELLRNILQEILGVMMNLFDPDQSGVIDRKRLLQYLDRVFRHLESNLILWKMYMAIFSQPAVQHILIEDIRHASNKPQEMLVLYFKKQGFKEPGTEFAFLSTLFSGVVYEYIADPEHYPLEQIKNRIISIYK